MNSTVKKIALATVVTGTVCLYRFCENAYLKELRQIFPTLTRKQFYKAWRNAIVVASKQTDGVADASIDKSYLIFITEVYKITHK